LAAAEEGRPVRLELAPPPAAMGALEDALWPSSGALDTEEKSLQLQISALGHDIAFSSAPASDDRVQSFLRTWNAYVQDFLNWRSAPWFWNPNRRDQLIEYRRRFNAFREQFLTLPGSSTTVQPVAGAKPADGPFDQAVKILNKVVIVVAIGAGLWVASTVYREARTIRSNPSRRRRRR
jgi:hypothetical protein